MPKKRPTTYAEIAYRNSGSVRTAARALAFALGWGLATAQLGREPASIEEYAEVAEESRATAFRHQQAFRKAFPTETTPLRINQASGAQERYDDLWRQLRNRKKFVTEAQPLVYSFGGAAAT